MFEKALRMIQEGQLEGIPGVTIQIKRGNVRIEGYSEQEADTLAGYIADALTDAWNV